MRCGGSASGLATGAIAQIPGFHAHGFLYINGTFSTIDVPGASNTFVSGISNAGQIVGYFSKGGKEHGFLYSDGSFTTIDVPGASSTRASGINDAGHIVGSYHDVHRFPVHSFLDIGGTFSNIDFPGSPDVVDTTAASDINNAGHIVGSVGFTGFDTIGFLNLGGTFTFIGDSSLPSWATGINDAGHIVGSFYQPIPEPGALIFFSLGLLGLGLTWRCKSTP